MGPVGPEVSAVVVAVVVVGLAVIVLAVEKVAVVVEVRSTSRVVMNGFTVTTGTISSVGSA